MKITFIGGGNMGEAMLSAILAKKLAVPKAIYVSDIKEPRRQYLERTYGVSVTDSNKLAAEEGDTDYGSVMAGQVCGLVDDILPVAELIERLICQAEAQIAAMNRLCVSGSSPVRSVPAPVAKVQGEFSGE